MIRVEMFEAFSAQELQKEINDWIECHDMLLHDIKHCHSRNSDYEHEIMYTAMLIYEVID